MKCVVKSTRQPGLHHTKLLFVQKEEFQAETSRCSVPQQSGQVPCKVAPTFAKPLRNIYPLVISHSYGKSPFLIGKSTLNGPFSIAMLNDQMVAVSAFLHYQYYDIFEHEH